jgi:hypothetical protein
MNFYSNFIQLLLCFLLMTTVAGAQSDSIPVSDTVMNAEVNEEAMQDFLIQTSMPFAVRAFSTLVSYRDSYSSGMGRKDNASRVTYLTPGFQLLALLKRQTTLGVSITGRRFMLHDFQAPITEVFKPDKNDNTATYLRHLILQSSYNLKLKRNRLFIAGNVFLPLSRNAEVVFNKRKSNDFIYKQVNAQFVFYRRYASYFSFNRGISATYRITATNVNKLVIRGFLLPVFQQRLSSRIYFTASAELNAMLVQPFFNSMYLNESVGIIYNGPFGILYSFQYGYYALGKNSNAQHSFNVSLKHEFKSFPIKKLKAS